MYFNISDIKTYNIDESYKQCFSNIKNSVEYSLAIDYMLERFDKNIVKEICLFLYKFKFATKKQIINIIIQNIRYWSNNLVFNTPPDT